MGNDGDVTTSRNKLRAIASGSDSEIFFFSGVPLMHVFACRTSLENASTFLQAEWIPMFADCTSASVPSARWYVGVLEVSSSLLVVGATHGF